MNRADRIERDRWRRWVIITFLVPIMAIGLMGAGSLAGDAEHTRPGHAATCIECHEFDAMFSHPTNVFPSMAVPSSLPLDSGRVTCTTCHKLDPTAAHATGASAWESLRIQAPGLCTTCHDGTRDARQLHASALGRAHLGEGERRDFRSPIDRESHGCLECHDGSLAADVGHQRDALGLGNPASHPIGIPYQLTNLDADGPLVPWSRLDSRIRLFDGRVGCGSCHSPYATNRDLLVMSNDRSALCLSCHEY